MEMYPPLYLYIQHAILSLTFIMLLTSLFNPICAIFGYFLIISFRPGELYPFLGAIRFELLAVIFIGIVILLKGRAGKASFGYHRINKAMFIFFGLGIISIIQAVDIAQSYDYAYRNLFVVFVFYIMMVSLAEETSDIKLFVYLYLVIVAYLAYLPIFNYFHGIGPVRGGAGIIQARGETGGVSGHVALANLMTQSLPFAYFMFMGEKGYLKKVLLCGFMVIYLVATIASGSRGGALGLVICAAIFIYKSKRKWLTLALMLSFYILASTLMSGDYLRWVSTILDFGSSDISAGSRWDGLRHGIEMAIRRPILGVGIGCYSIARSEWFHWGIWAHNHYGELIGEMGILGSISWAWLIYLCFKEISRIKDFIHKKRNSDRFYKNLMDACQATLVLRLIIGMTTHSLMSYIWYMIAGILVVTSKSLERTYPDFGSKEVRVEKI